MPLVRQRLKSNSSTPYKHPFLFANNNDQRILKNIIRVAFASCSSSSSSTHECARQLLLAIPPFSVFSPSHVQNTNIQRIHFILKAWKTHALEENALSLVQGSPIILHSLCLASRRVLASLPFSILESLNFRSLQSRDIQALAQLAFLLEVPLPKEQTKTTSPLFVVNYFLMRIQDAKSLALFLKELMAMDGLRTCISNKPWKAALRVCIHQLGHRLHALNHSRQTITDTLLELGELTGWVGIPELLLSLFRDSSMNDLFVSLAREFPEDVLLSLVEYLETLDEYACVVKLLRYNDSIESADALLDVYLRSAGKSGPLADHVVCGFYDVLEEYFDGNLDKFVWHGHSDPHIAKERQDYLHDECDFCRKFLLAEKK